MAVTVESSENVRSVYGRLVPVGRPPKPIDPTASAGAAFGAAIRARRTARGWTLQTLSDRIDYSPQHISDAEHAVATLAALSDPQRSDHFIRRLGLRTLAVCERENVAGVAELRDVLSAA